MFNAVLVRPREYMVRVQTGGMYLSILRESIENTFERRGLSARVRIVDNVRLLIDSLNSLLNQYLSVLQYVPGISSFSPVVEIEKDYSVLVKTIVAILLREKARRFRIELQGQLDHGREELTALLSKAVVDETGAMWI
jgi:thiamine biosynthesis protein ThiI